MVISTLKTSGIEGYKFPFNYLWNRDNHDGIIDNITRESLILWKYKIASIWYKDEMEQMEGSYKPGEYIWWLS